MTVNEIEVLFKHILEEQTKYDNKQTKKQATILRGTYLELQKFAGVQRRLILANSKGESKEPEISKEKLEEQELTNEEEPEELSNDEVLQEEILKKAFKELEELAKPKAFKAPRKRVVKPK